MGLTRHSYDLLKKHTNPCNLLELGNQTVYFGNTYGSIAKALLTKEGYDHTSIDINGRDGALPMDLGTPLAIEPFDVVTDFGTSEHVVSYYNVWLNKYKACRVGGLIISENPKTGNWSGHGHHYLTEKFYTELAKKSGMEILELGEHPAMGNTTNGWNVYCVLRKVAGSFISKEAFNKLDFRTK